MKNKVKDLTGQKFGRLTVVERDMNDPAKRSKWICRCDCGNICSVYSNHLKSGQTTSCGCARKGVNLRDITGQRFGRLVTIERTEKKVGHSYVYKCRCDCGAICYVDSASLKGGQTTSCGCYAAEVHKKSVRKMVNERKKYYVENTDIIGICNRPIPKNNTSGCMGVSWDKSVKIWKAKIVFQGRSYYLGSSRDYETAVQLRKNAEEKIYGDFIQWYAETYPKRWKKMQEQSDQLK